MIAYKFLRADGSTVFSRFRWPLPGNDPGPWVEAPVDPRYEDLWVSADSSIEIPDLSSMDLDFDQRDD